MKKLFFLLFLTLFSCKTMQKNTSLKTDILNELKGVQGDFAVAFLDLQNPKNTLFINESEVFHAASTMKTAVMIEIFRKIDRKELRLQDSILVKNQFSSIVDGSPYSISVDSEDSGEKLYDQIGQKKLLKDLVYDMIIHSSNLATNIVIELSDAKKVTQSIRELGTQKMEVLRGVEDIKAFEKGLNNTTTAYDLLILMQAIEQKKAASPSSCEAMIQILLDQKFKDIIPAYLPKELKVAHKTGSITGVRHDSGIIYLPNGKKYVLVLLSKNLQNPDAGVETMAKISKKIYLWANENI